MTEKCSDNVVTLFNIILNSISFNIFGLKRQFSFPLFILS